MDKKYLIACLLDARKAYEKSSTDAQEYSEDIKDGLIEYCDDHIEAIDNAVFVLNNLSWIAAAATVSLVCMLACLLAVCKFIY